ncbi:LytR C-terminal domain-containing protein [Arthrobacter rhizosphaerae]|uniref:LytR C-terminal domain-containing protein n=1 Tax=Arthrobacter rhizosphaerae TaxID=2855490 RepID=UPI001FF1DBEE|nr:LytR C-terminal domain-containing protein [Arthrobacter rhizosphaerae]
MTKYARDEFDRIPEASSRQGVHRVAAGPAKRKLGPILTVGVAALAVGLAAFLLFPKLGISTADPLAMFGRSASESTPGEAGAIPSTPEPSQSPAPLATTSESNPPSPTPQPTTPLVDKSQPVAVYNGTATAGLAGRIAGQIQTDGWTPDPVGNWGGLPQQTSVIYYNGEARKAAAAALGTLLKIPTLVDSAEFQQPLVVVLGPGYE